MNVPLSIFIKVAMRTPDVFMAIARETIRSKSARWTDYRRGNGKAKPPRYVDIRMTNRCNLRCSMCGQWGTNGIYRDAGPEAFRDEMDLDVLKGIADEAAGFRPMFYLWGGEPFLSPNLLPFLEYLKSRRMLAAINTNGTFLADAAEDLVRFAPANILVSVDGPREVHDRVRGREGTFDKVMAGVERLLALKRERKASKPYVTFVTTVNTANASAFPDVYDIAAELGVDFMGLQFGTFTTEETGQAYQERMRRCLGCDATSWRGFLSYQSDVDVPAIQEGVRRVRSRKHPFGTYFMPDLEPEDVPGYYAGTLPVKGCKACIVPWMRTDLLPNGDVYPCIDFPDYIVGNVRETPLMELWNGPRYVRFRQELQKGLFPICGRCSTLYEF